MGAACGRTLFAIEELLQNDLSSTDERTPTTATRRPVFAPNRPLCLWDVGSAHPQPITDAFGRSPLYARISNKTKHVASIEQYHQDESLESSGIWDDFVRIHWPDLNRNTSGKEQHLTTSKSHTNSREKGGEKSPLAPGDDTTIWNGDAGSSSKERTQTAI